MNVYYVLLGTVIALFSLSVIFAFWWAVRRGQVSDFAKGATSIFDDEEPPGVMTDAFPGQEPRTTRGEPKEPGR